MSIWDTIETIELQLKQLKEQVEHLENGYHIERAKNKPWHTEEEVNKIFVKAGLPPLGKTLNAEGLEIRDQQWLGNQEG